MSKKLNARRFEIAMAVFSGVTVVSVVLFFHYWTTMQQIEAQGLLGQAAYQQEYDSATNSLKWAAVGVSGGFLLFLYALGLLLISLLEDIFGD